MSSNINSLNTNLIKNNISSSLTEVSPKLYRKIAEYILKHYHVLKAPQFENMPLAEVLKQKPVILLGEIHDNNQHRKYHSWIINELYHNQAILLTESKHTGQVGQTQFVHPSIIKGSKSWVLKNPSMGTCEQTVNQH